MSNLIVIIVIGLLGGVAIGLQAPLAAMMLNAGRNAPKYT